MKKCSKGFTLVELMVVLVILAIVSGIAVPGFTGYIDSSKEKECVIRRKALVARLDEALVTNPNAAMADVISSYADELTCPAGGTYTASNNITVSCSLHGSTSSLSGVELVSKADGSASSGGSDTPVTEAPETTKPIESEKQTESSVPSQTEKPVEPETSKTPETNSDASISSDGKTITINGLTFSAGTWPELRAEALALEYTWYSVYFGSDARQMIYTENGKAYAALEYRHIFKEDVNEAITIAEYNENVMAHDDWKEKRVIFYELNLSRIYDFSEMSESERLETSQVGDIICYNGEYYLNCREGVTYNVVQCTNNGWEKLWQP